MDIMSGTEMDDAFEKAALKSKGKKPSKPKPKKKTKPAKSKTKKTPKRNPWPIPVVRSERLDMRLSKAEKAKINAKAKKTKRTVTSLVLEAIGKIR